MSTSGDPGQLETAADLGDKPDAIVRRWVMWLDLARGERAKKWRERGHKVVKRYKDERGPSPRGKERVRFNILFSNTETLKSPLYSRTPTPDVRRRFLDKDPVARQAAEILQRTISYHTDALDFDGMMESVRDDYLLPGMGVARVRYVPKIETARQKIYVRPINAPLATDEAGPTAVPAPTPLAPGADPADVPAAPPGQPPTHVRMDSGEPIAPGTPMFSEGGSSFVHGEEFERVVWEECVPEYQPWDDWCWSPAKQWKDVDAVAFRALLTREQCVQEFGPEIGKAVPLNWSLTGARADDGKQDAEKSIFKHAEIWEIWDRSKRQVLAICRDYADAPCKVIDDPLGLHDFFPVPEPIVGVRTTDEFLPTPEFTLYQDQADELDRLTDRIDKLTSALKYRAVYDGSEPELASLLGKGDNAMVAIKDGAAFREKGGLAAVIWTLPLADLASVIDKLTAQREQVKVAIHELTGISDLLRGKGNPQATATAEALKGRWGSMRISRRQKQVARFARDIFRLMGEIIATKFSWETLSIQSGVTLPSDSDVALAKQALGLALQSMSAPPAAPPGGPPGAPPQPGAPPPAGPPGMGHNGPPPEALEALKEAAASVTREQVMALLRSEGPRGFRIDVETDSTVEPDASEEQQNRIALLTAIGGFMTQMGPMIEQGILSKALGREMLLFAVRAFKVGAQLEDALETLGQETDAQGAPPKPDPAMIKAQASVQAEQARAQADITIAEHKAEVDKSLAEFKAQLQASAAQQQAFMEQQKHQADMQAQSEKHATALLHKQQAHDMEIAHQAQAAAAPQIVIGGLPQ